MPWALASRSFMREASSKPIAPAIWAASAAQGRLGVSTWPSRTAPAIPKHAAETVWLCLARNLWAISSGPLYSRLGKTSIVTGVRRSGVPSKKARRVLVPPMSPAKIIRIAPVAVIFSHQFVGFRRAPGSGWIIREAPRWQCVPDVQDGGDDVPGGLHHVGALEQCCIAEHAIVEQPLIAGLRGGLEIIRVVEIHIDAADLDDGPGELCAEA